MIVSYIRRQMQDQTGGVRPLHETSRGAGVFLLASVFGPEAIS